MSNMKRFKEDVMECPDCKKRLTLRGPKIRACLKHQMILALLKK